MNHCSSFSLCCRASLAASIPWSITKCWNACLPGWKRGEIGLHALREAIYAMLFAASAWYAWHGAWGLVIAALLAVEIIVDAIDEFVENHTTALPQNERLLHFTMIMNLGLIAATLMLVLLDWAPRPTALLPASHGLWSRLPSLMSLRRYWRSLRLAGPYATPRHGGGSVRLSGRVKAQSYRPARQPSGRIRSSASCR
jgi:hypothetical protein